MSKIRLLPEESSQVINIGNIFVFVDDYLAVRNKKSCNGKRLCCYCNGYADAGGVVEKENEVKRRMYSRISEI